MKRIEFIQPVESMRGSFGAKQDLRYAENDNKAFESPDGKTNYARNYQPTFIGAKVARTGKKYFSVKVKSATNNTAAWRLMAALMGACSAIYGWCIKQLDKMAQLAAQYTLAVEQGFEGTLRKFILDGVRASLAAKAATITVVGPTATVTLGNNPFSTAAEAIAISAKLLAKFWLQLAPNGITFNVAGKQGVAVSGQTFRDIANIRTSPQAPDPTWGRINVLHVYYVETVLQDEDMAPLMLGNQYVADAEGYAVKISLDGDSTVITSDMQLHLVDVQPPYRQ